MNPKKKTRKKEVKFVYVKFDDKALVKLAENMKPAIIELAKT